MTPRLIAPFVVIPLLLACNSGGTSAPGAVSEGEAQALEEAAEMLDERRLPEGALPDAELPETDANTPQEETQ